MTSDGNDVQPLEDAIFGVTRRGRTQLLDNLIKRVQQRSEDEHYRFVQTESAHAAGMYDAFAEVLELLATVKGQS